MFVVPSREVEATVCGIRPSYYRLVHYANYVRGIGILPITTYFCAIWFTRVSAG